MSIFLIAEIGINHNGDLDIAKKLIDAAKESGCDSVKFQKRDIDTVYTEEYLKSYRKSPWGETQRSQKEGLEFNYENYCEIDKYCKKLDIQWFASAWDLKSQKFLKQFNCTYNKIASPMNVYLDLMECVAEEGKHTFISTGMSTEEDIKVAVNIFRKHNCPFELMHTVSTYPMNHTDANLNMINSLKNTFKCNVGYSGHEDNIEISLAAAAIGVSSIERHLTLDKKMYGSDQSASIEPKQMKKLAFGIREIEKYLGDGKKRILPEEIEIAKKLRQHLK